jgi:hypothetical protein
MKYYDNFGSKVFQNIRTYGESYTQWISDSELLNHLHIKRNNEANWSLLYLELYCRYESCAAFFNNEYSLPRQLSIACSFKRLPPLCNPT